MSNWIEEFASLTSSAASPSRSRTMGGAVDTCAGGSGVMVTIGWALAWNARNTSASSPVDPSSFRYSPVLTMTLRSEEHTSELQSLMRISYAVFCLKQKTTHTTSKLTH